MNILCNSCPLALTANCDLFGSINEEGLNMLARHIMLQRPSLFNYATNFIIQHPDLLCKEIIAAPIVIKRNNPLITEVDPLPVFGITNQYGNIYALNFCFQLTSAKIDFHPGNVFDLPPEQNPPLKEQRFALLCEVCGGIGCPSKGTLEYPPILEKNVNVLPTDELTCFCLKLFVIGLFKVKGIAGNQKLEVKMEENGLEIVDITPSGLEANMECYLNVLLHLVLLPRLRIAIEKMVFDVLNIGIITLSASPISSKIKHNPAIEDNQLKIFIDVS